MKIDSFETLAREAGRDLKLEQEAFLDFFKIPQYQYWSFNPASGVFTFRNDDDEKLFFAYQNIGTYSPKDENWLWAWANKNTYPNIKTSSVKLREFGEEHDLKKLVNPSWEAEEIDAWEMVSVAHKLLKPLGVYRFAADNNFIFIIFTEELTDEEAQKKKEKAKSFIKCEAHGVKKPPASGQE